MNNTNANNQLPSSIKNTSWVLDSSIPLPGGYRIGLDGLLGLIPGVGDAVTGSFSALIIYKAHQLGAPVSVLFKMVINVLLDTIVGLIPIAGDLFDFAFKSNTRNVKLLEDYLNEPQRSGRRSRVFMVISVTFLVLFALLACWILVTVISAVWEAVVA